MSYIEFYNFLDGKNLCNIFSNLIITKINKEVTESISEITVVNVKNFFIVKGSTNFDKTINLSELFQNFLKQYDVDLSNKVRVIDCILYNKKLQLEQLNISESYNKSEEIDRWELNEKLNKYVNQKVYFNLKLHKQTRHIYYDCSSEQMSSVISTLEKEFPDHTLIKSDFSNEIHMSDKIYGLSDKLKFYHLLLWSVKNHLFNLGISKKLEVCLYSDANIKHLDNLNVNFVIKNNDHIVKTDWLESLILDTFPFDLKSLNNVFKEDIDLEDFITKNENKFLFQKMIFSKDIVLF